MYYNNYKFRDTAYLTRNNKASASSLDSISAASGEFVVIVEFDLLDYKRRTNNRAVKKTLSIPEWLNEAGMAAGLNFSQVLQDALKEQLLIKR